MGVTKRDRFDGYYFKDGDLCSEVTGGWVTTYNLGGYASGTGYLPDSGGTTIGVKVTKTSQAACVGTVNKIDLSKVSTLRIKVTSASAAETLAFRVLTEKNITKYSKTVSLVNKGGQEVTIDVSGLTGSYYLALVAIAVNASYLTAYVSEVRGE
jgi:hypothetical protein